jgi:ferredoxin
VGRGFCGPFFVKELFSLLMIVTEQNTFHAFLSRQDETSWVKVLSRLVPTIHPVDQAATRVWFAFWPLKLARSLRETSDPALVAKRFLLDGNYRLEHQIDSSVEFLYASRYWSAVKKAVLVYAESANQPDILSLEEQICRIAEGIAREQHAAESVVLGVTAVAVMILQQVGVQTFAQAAAKPYQMPESRRTPEEVLRSRQEQKKNGFFNFLHKIDKRLTVTFDETRGDGCFHVINSQDLSMASAGDLRNYQDKDHRRIAGPIPAQCRSGACGYCWVGVLSGQENLSPVSPFERRRLNYFGYATRDMGTESHPPVRLACQAKSQGNLTIVIPPWNGVLNGRE